MSDCLAKMYKKHASDSRPNLSSTFDEARKKEVKLALNIMMVWSRLCGSCFRTTRV